MWFDNQFEKDFRRLSDRFFAWDDVFENQSGDQVLTYGPYYYGYQMTVGPDGKPQVREWGNVRPNNVALDSQIRTPNVDQIYDKEQKTLKLVAEMPGIEKKDIKVTVDGKLVHINAEHEKRKYEAKVPIQHKVDENSVKATYANGILEISFKTAEEIQTGKQVPVL